MFSDHIDPTTVSVLFTALMVVLAAGFLTLVGKLAPSPTPDPVAWAARK